MGLNPLATAFWITVTSVVMRVMSDEVERRSRFSDESAWTFPYSAWRRFAPSPMAAREAKRA